MRETDKNISKAAYPSEASLDDSRVSGEPRKCGPAEEVRHKNNAHRDSRTNLGKGKHAIVEVE